MPSTRDIRRRIKSVKNTRQITRAMELVAASRMKKAQDMAIAGREYTYLLADILSSISTRLTEVNHPLLESREIRTRGILLLTTDRGLCGPLNSNIFRLVTEITDPARFVSVGRKGTQFLGRSQRPLIADFSVDDSVPFQDVLVVAEFMVEQFLKGEIDTVEVLFPRFINTLIQEPTMVSLLPLPDLEEMVRKLRAGLHHEETEHVVDDRQMLFEPDLKELLKSILPLYVNREIYQFMLSTKAAEHSARMVAMKSATDNAGNLLDDLNLEFNKARQAAITQEILEIAAATASG
ncbi:MAG: ATP synthase F1 subunit gamma [Verrucomicrobia bacterium]|nr:MAG: ATP synthase F1 subunit gamma [Verrucomicrobiota bacterium]